MTPKEYQTAIDTLGMTQTASSRFFGATDRTVRRWIAGDNPVPRPVEILLLYMTRRGMTPDAILRICFQNQPKEGSIMSEITYCDWEGTPGLVVRDHKKRHVHVYEFVDGKWREPADHGADIVHKSSEITAAEFKRRFPSADIPPSLGR